MNKETLEKLVNLFLSIFAIIALMALAAMLIALAAMLIALAVSCWIMVLA